MKLNPDILYHELKEMYNVTISGPRSTALTLGRPQFYMEDENTFQPDHLYLATVEHLPHRPVIKKNVVLVCIGENLRMKYYSDRLCLITIRDKADFFRVFQRLQEIFDRYDQWERELYKQLIDNGDIPAILHCSLPVFRNPLIVIDASFRIIAGTDEKIIQEWGNEMINADNLSSYLSSTDLMTEKKGALHIDLHGKKTLCVNLFDPNEVYEGCLCILVEDTGFEERTSPLAEFLAHIIEAMIEKNPQVINDEHSSLKSIFRTLLEERPITQSQRWQLNASNNKTEYVCISLEYASSRNQVPPGYICDLFESTFENAYALQLDTGIVCFAEYGDKLFHEITEFVRQIDLKAGISDGFSDLFTIRTYYSQAVSALENGNLLKPEECVFFFTEYALTTMIINSLGDMPAEAYFPNGLKEILRHDRESEVSYFETLQVFLEENMSYTSAAKRLFIHRSTLIDRIARIERDLKIDLQNTDQRLLLEILLKAVNIEKQLRQK